MDKVKRFSPPAHFSADNYIPLTELEGEELIITGISKMNTRFGGALIMEVIYKDQTEFVITSSKRIAAMFEGYTAFPVAAKFTKNNNKWSVE